MQDILDRIQVICGYAKNAKFRYSMRVIYCKYSLLISATFSIFAWSFALIL